MTTPVLWVLAGPNGAGKTTLYDKVLSVHVGVEFVNADLIAHEMWPGDEVARSYDAAQIAAARRQQLLTDRRSFIAETVFSHESKLQLMRDAADRGFIVMLHVVLIPQDLAVARVANRVEVGGHDVPEDKVRSRYQRLWGHVREAIKIADEAVLYDNTSAAAPLQPVATYLHGSLIGRPVWPTWIPAEQQIQRYEANDYRSTSLARLCDIANALGVTVAQHAELKPSAA